MAKPDPRMAMYDEQTRFAGILYVVMLVIVVAFAGFVWNLYSGRETPRLTPPSASYKVEPPPEAANIADPVEQNAMYQSLEGQTESAATPLPAPEEPMPSEAAPTSGAPRLGQAPNFVGNGPFVAQIAALQSNEAVDAAWARLASRAPGLFAQARLDVERADLGQRGVYYRVRAGYFADRANATRFCDRIKQMGQDCIVVQR